LSLEKRIAGPGPYPFEAYTGGSAAAALSHEIYISASPAVFLHDERGKATRVCVAPGRRAEGEFVVRSAGEGGRSVGSAEEAECVEGDE